MKQRRLREKVKRKSMREGEDNGERDNYTWEQKLERVRLELQLPTATSQNVRAVKTSKPKLPCFDEQKNGRIFSETCVLCF